MASISYPRPGHNGGFVTEFEHELLAKKSIAEGVHGFPTDPAPVFADGTGTRVVKVRANVYATLRASQYHSGSTDIALPSLAANTSGNPRIDLVVLRLDRSDYSVKETVITGTPAANPVAPSPVRNTGSTGVYDLPLAQVRVNNGATALASGTVTIVCWYIGSDGQYRCTPDTRPPHEAGRAIWDHPGRYLVSTGTTWKAVYEDTGWVDCTPANGWGVKTTGYAKVRRKNGNVTLKVDLFRTASNSVAAGAVSNVATLPAGFAPAELLIDRMTMNQNGAGGRFTVNPNGVVSISYHPGVASGQAVSGVIPWPQD